MVVLLVGSLGALPARRAQDGIASREEAASKDKDRWLEMRATSLHPRDVSLPPPTQRREVLRLRIVSRGDAALSSSWALEWLQLVCLFCSHAPLICCPVCTYSGALSAASIFVVLWRDRGAWTSRPVGPL